MSLGERSIDGGRSIGHDSRMTTNEDKPPDSEIDGMNAV